MGIMVARKQLYTGCRFRLIRLYFSTHTLYSHDMSADLFDLNLNCRECT